MHTFHIPVMGTGFSIDTPVKVAPYGISSAVSLVDDMLIEKMRAFYCKKFNHSFKPISEKKEDHRAKRITAYLNLMKQIVRDKFETMFREHWTESERIQKYINMLPDSSELKKSFQRVKLKYSAAHLQEWLKEYLKPGSIDVNIMTKVDKQNFQDDDSLPRQYNDAHAALRGFAKSDLSSTVIFSAGMNPSLYGYIGQFEDFYPDRKGNIEKKVCLKVSDYRSALIQGKFLAKKGIWVSEYRIESGLNCGGHAFATQGYLMGPILEEISQKKEELVQTNFTLLKQALEAKGYAIPSNPPNIRITAQGGVGTAQEHRFLLDHFNLDSIGWGTPFLLVPEATIVDKKTMRQLCKAGENELELSDISPLNVPFHNLKSSTKEQEKQRLIEKGRPGSACPKKYLELFNTEFTETPICTASRLYQYSKLNELDEREISPEQHQKEFDKIVNKSCICNGLGTPALLVNDLDTRVEGEGVSICPGPNMAYFSKTVRLNEMIDHIYGRKEVMVKPNRPHMFMKELELYVDYLSERMIPSSEGVKKITRFWKNLTEGIQYYKKLLSKDLLPQFCRSDLARLENVLFKIQPEQLA